MCVSHPEYLPAGFISFSILCSRPMDCSDGIRLLGNLVFRSHRWKYLCEVHVNAMHTTHTPYFNTHTLLYY